MRLGDTWVMSSRPGHSDEEKPNFVGFCPLKSPDFFKEVTPARRDELIAGGVWAQG